jgi:hypothetical protein
MTAYSFFTSSLDGGQWLDSRAGRFNPEKKAPVTHLTRNWMDSEAIWSVWRKNNSLGPVGDRTMIPLLVTILTELSRLRQESETMKHSQTVSLCPSTLPRLPCCMFGQDWSSSRYCTYGYLAMRRLDLHNGLYTSMSRILNHEPRNHSW